jgi:hypothetical protein
MHFHLPKPLHGWREFLHEVAIIVLGVLIALGLEQVVTSSHDRAGAAETRASIRSEIGENLQRILRRQRTEVCLMRRRREIGVFLDATTERQHPTRPTWIGAPYAPLAGDTAFKSAQSAGKFFLLPQDEQQKINVFYVDGADFNEQNTREWYDWAQLRSLTSAGTLLTESEITRLRQALQDARGADWLIREDITEFIRLAKEGGISTKDHPIPDEQLAPACLPINMPYAQASAKANRKDLGIPE